MEGKWQLEQRPTSHSLQYIESTDVYEHSEHELHDGLEMFLIELIVVNIR